MASHLFVTCRCGKRIPVTAGMAGSLVKCECGQDNAVPTLRELSQQSRPEDAAASAPDSSDPLVLIRSYLEHGQPPAGSACIQCQGVTENQILCELDGWQSGWEDPSAAWIVRWFRRIRGARREPTASGNRAPLQIPVRLCAPCFRRAGDLDHAGTLRRLLERSALYRQLYSSYPRATFRYLKSRSA